MNTKQTSHEEMEENTHNGGIEKQGCKKDELQEVDWTYIGEGEWVQIGEDRSTGPPTHIPKETELAARWLQKMDADIKIHHDVMEKGYPNRHGARIPLKIAL